ncbi:MAG: hypothetical protein HQK52_18760 [Oligoflexia bacterium]|nr:hypothetical protein [Oligoflexia bacterium]
MRMLIEFTNVLPSVKVMNAITCKVGKTLQNFGQELHHSCNMILEKDGEIHSVMITCPAQNNPLLLAVSRGKNIHAALDSAFENFIRILKTKRKSTLRGSDRSSAA